MIPEAECGEYLSNISRAVESNRRGPWCLTRVSDLLPLATEAINLLNPKLSWN